jgi:hypothetical protein
MERQYGRKNLKKLAAKYKEDRANQEWIEKSTMACPKCHVHVEKSMGCNHVSGSASHPSGVVVMLIWWGTADDLFQVQATFLLPLWVET